MSFRFGVSLVLKPDLGNSFDEREYNRIVTPLKVQELGKMKSFFSKQFPFSLILSLLTWLAVLSPPATASDLEERGFLGLWRGEYNCNGWEFGVDLHFTRDRISSDVVLTWTFYPLTAGSTVKTGSFSGTVVPSESPSGARMTPKAWIERPSGYSMVSTEFTLETEGQLTGKIDFRGCNDLVAQKIEEPKEADKSEIALDAEFLNTLSGRWRGEFTCSDTRYIAELQMPRFSSEDVAATLLYRKREQFDTVTNQKIGFHFGGERENIEVHVLERLSYKLNQQTYAPVTIRADADFDVLTVSLDESACSEPVFQRDNPVGPVAILPVPATPSQETLFAPDLRDENRIYLASSRTACDALKGWRAQITDSDARLQRAGSYVTSWGAWPTLFADSKFMPFFGVSYGRIAETPQIANLMIQRLMRKECQQLGDKIDLDPTVVNAAFGVKRTGFGSKFHMFQVAVADMNKDAGLLQELIAEIDNVTLDAAGLSVLGGIETQVQALASLSEADGIEIDQRITERRTEIAMAMDDAFLNAIASGRVTMSFSDVLSAEKIAGSRDGAEKERITNLIKDRLMAIVDAEIIVPSKTLDGLGLRSFVDRQRERFEPLQRYRVVSEGFAMLEQRIVEGTERRLAAINESIAATTTIPNLRTAYNAVSSFAQEPGLARFANQAWAAYDSKAESLLNVAVSRLPDRDVSPRDRPTTSGAMAGLHRNADITAFLRGDKLAAYQASRQSTLIYVAELANVFRTYCPAALPPRISTLIAGKFVNLNALTGDRDAMALEGWKAIAKGLQVLADPGPAMREALDRDELRTSATADAQILLNALPCTGPELREMFLNIEQWVRDPALGIADEDKNLFDICLDAVGGGLVMRETREYCNCASERIRRSSRAKIERYLRTSPREHWRQVVFLDRRLSRNLQACRR